MRVRFRTPSPALVISVIALFVALGGSGYAAVKINGSRLKNKSVSGKKLKNRTITRKKIKKRTLTGAEIRAPEAYREVGSRGQPPFTNGARNYGNGYSTTAFFRDNDWIVHLKGTLTAITGRVVFTLPPGYRPPLTLDIGVIASSRAAWIYVRPNGEVEVHGPAGTANYGLDGVSFRAADGLRSRAGARSKAGPDPNKR